MFVLPTGGPGDGLFPAHIEAVCTNRSGGALAVGDVVVLDLATSATETDNNTPGSADASGNNSGFNSVIDPATAYLKQGIYGVALEAIADDAAGKILFRGVADVNVATNLDLGESGTPQNASNQLLEGTGSTGAKIIAIALEDEASNIASCLFDGIHGFGADAG